MNQYEKKVAQIERKGDPIHSYVTVVVPLSDKAHKFFRTDENSEIEEIKRLNRQITTKNASMRIDQIKKIHSLLHTNFDFYYDDPNETEEERKKIVLHQAIEQFSRLKPHYWSVKDFVYEKDYDIEVMKTEQ